MATQRTKIIDITRTYAPVDPDSFPETMHGTGREDSPEEPVPVMAFEGINFLPTSYGYKSFFGVNSEFKVDSILNADEMFIIQTQQFANIAVALCPDGIYVNYGPETVDDSASSWEQAIALDAPEEGVFLQWSVAVIRNSIYVYRAQGDSYFVFSPIELPVSAGEIAAGASPGTHPANEFYAVTPNFLNMEGQQGIFNAGGVLGFWDSANATAFSSPDDFAQFEPAVLKGTNIITFAKIAGRIVNILSFENGFVIYCTKSIVVVSRDSAAAGGWKDSLLEKENGIALPRECCYGETVGVHYAYTNRGLLKINQVVTQNDRAEVTAAQVVDFLKESKEPIFLRMLNNRYLFLEILDPDYLNGQVTFTVETIPSLNVPYPNFNVTSQVTNVRNSLRDLTTLNENAYGLFDAYLVAEGLPLRKEGSEIEVVTTYNWGDYARQALADWPVIEWSGPSTMDTEDFSFGSMGAYEALNNVLVGGTLFYPCNSSVDFLRRTPSVPTDTVDNDEIPVPANGSEFVDKFYEYLDLYGQKMRSAMTTLRATNPHEEDGNMILCVSFIADNSTPPMGFTYASSADTTIIDGGLYTGRTFKLSKEDPWDPSTETASYNSGTFGTTRIVAFRDNYEFVTTENRVTISVEPAVAGTVGSTLDIKGVFTEGFYDDMSFLAYMDTYYAETDSSGTLATAYAETTGYNYTDVDDEEHFVAFDELDSLIDLEAGQSYTLSDSGSLNLPASSFILQEGSVGPIRPTIAGALVYDTQLQKWGKLKMNYKLLLDWSPLNASTGRVVTYDTFGVDAGVYLADGSIAKFDQFPVDSYIKYGKIGYYRAGFTSAEEMRVHFRSPFTGKIRSEASIDGRNVELGIASETEFTAVTEAIHYPSISARWHTISVIGVYDIRHVEFRGTTVSNR